jgi:hypothetical protein
MKRFKRKFKRFTPLSPALLRSQFYRVETNPKKTARTPDSREITLQSQRPALIPKQPNFIKPKTPKKITPIPSQSIIQATPELLNASTPQILNSHPSEFL